MSEDSKPLPASNAKKDPRARLQSLVGSYTARRAAEVMAHIKEGSDDLASEAIEVLRQRVKELEQENHQLREELARYRSTDAG